MGRRCRLRRCHRRRTYNHSTSTGALAAASNSPKHFLLISQQVSGGNFCVNWNFGKNLKKIRQMEVIDPQSALRS